MAIWLKLFKVFAVIRNVQSQISLVVNTTCLELGKPANQQFRLTCSQYEYHCLLDETFTKEFEVCREWKWIPGGKCAYFNTYGSGNVDERQCEPGINLTCSESKHQFESNKNTQFTACYAKKKTTSSLPTTISSIQVTSNRTSDGDISTSYSTSKAWIIFCIAVFLTSIPVIFFIQRRPGCKRLCKKAYDEESPKSTDRKSIAANSEQGKMLEQNEQTTVSDEESEVFVLAPTSPQVLQKKSKKSEQEDDNDKLSTNEAGNNKSADDDEKTQIFKEIGPTKDDKLSTGKEKSAVSTSGSSFHPVIINNEEESTDVFKDTVESIHMIAPPTEKQDRELCTELFNLLEVEGRKLSQEVMVAIITRTTGKSVKDLVTDEEVLNKLKEIMPEELHYLLKSSSGCEESIHVSYSLLRSNLDKEHYPKSDWSSPVDGKDVGIGDDVERLHRIYSIVCGISNPVTVSVESYIRLLDIMCKALIRLDPDVEFKEDFKALATRLTSIKNPSWTPTIIIKTVTFFKVVFKKK